LENNLHRDFSPKNDKLTRQEIVFSKVLKSIHVEVHKKVDLLLPDALNNGARSGAKVCPYS